MAAPRLGGPKDFWKEIKSISVAEIARDANRPLSIAIVGEEELCRAAIHRLYQPDMLSPADHTLPQTPFLQVYATMSADDGFPQAPDVFDFVIDVGGGRTGAAADFRTTVYSINELGGWDATLDRVFEDRPEMSLALARNFPVFRRKAAAAVIQHTAMTNAEFSLVTGVASAFPLFGLILSANALSDILILTKNQIMMSLRLAAVYGLEVNYKSRMRELAPILVNAFSWRAVARELVGAVPAVGFVFRAMISYAGTVAVGRAAQVYYESGETISRSQAQRYYREAYAGSKERIRALAKRVRPGRSGARKRTALPPGDAAVGTGDGAKSKLE